MLLTDWSAGKDEVDDNDGAQVVDYDESEMNDKDNKQIVHHCIGLPVSAVGSRIFVYFVLFLKQTFNYNYIYVPYLHLLQLLLTVIYFVHV